MKKNGSTDLVELIRCTGWQEKVKRRRIRLYVLHVCHGIRVDDLKKHEPESFPVDIRRLWVDWRKIRELMAKLHAPTMQQARDEAKQRYLLLWRAAMLEKQFASAAKALDRVAEIDGLRLGHNELNINSTTVNIGIEAEIRALPDEKLVEVLREERSALGRLPELLEPPQNGDDDGEG